MTSGERIDHRPWLIPAVIFVVTALAYVIVAGPRITAPSPNNHFVLLAESWLDGRLDLVAGRPPHQNDFACFDANAAGACAADAFYRGAEGQRWYISFPPFPAALVLLPTAVFGTDFSDPLFWAIFGGLPPAFLFLLLRRLRLDGLSQRSRREELLLVALFAFASVYFSTAVQGSVWFCAHVVASLLLVLFLHFAIGARRPLLAGLMLGLCFLTRPSTSPFALFFLLEALRAHQRRSDGANDKPLVTAVLGADWPKVIRSCAMFAAPIAALGGLAMWMNHARFADPFEFGHSYLMIRWRGRIDRWGLFNYHYLSKNLAVFLTSLPWFSAEEPHMTISRHGLALWVTSPNLLWVLWPKRVSPLMVTLGISAALVAFWDLLYQNSGWVQFGYRFSLDYMPALIVLLALGKRRFGKFFVLALVFAIGINLFGGITFDRVWQFYDDDATQERVFQPD